MLATRNPAKVQEISKYLEQEFELIGLANLEDVPQVNETGETFRANAILKAQKYFEWSGIPTLADDGGLEIKMLNNQPGVKSRRWPGYEATDQELISLAITRLSRIPWEQRQASLITVGAFHDGIHTLTQSGSIDGYITKSQTERCRLGYPFRSIFWVPEFNKLFSQLSEEEHDRVNHRKKVYEALALKISELAK